MPFITDWPVLLLPIVDMVILLSAIWNNQKVTVQSYQTISLLPTQQMYKPASVNICSSVTQLFFIRERRRKKHHTQKLQTGSYNCDPP